MLDRTFIHGAGVGAATERGLWLAGARDWATFLAMQRGGALPGSHKRGGKLERLAGVIEDSRAALASGDVEYFRARLPGPEMWRMHAPFAGRAAYVDIETTGLSPAYDVVTVVALHDGTRCHTFVRGDNLADFPRMAAQFALLVTFNGATFDIPFLQTTFPDFAPRAHLDLRYPLARLGHKGGLKEIERRVGIQRPRHLAELDGFDAVRLWRQHERGDRAALPTLLAYAEQDVANLVTLAAIVGRDMPARVGFTLPS